MLTRSGADERGTGGGAGTLRRGRTQSFDEEDLSAEPEEELDEESEEVEPEEDFDSFESDFDADSEPLAAFEVPPLPLRA